MADRDYFEAFKDGTRIEPYLGAPVRSRVNGAWIVVLARRLNAGGEFRGLVLGIIALDAIEGFYSSVTTKPDSTDARLVANLQARFPFILDLATLP